MACISPCPTGSIDNWRTMPRVKAYSVEEQLQLGRAAGRADAGAAGRRRRGAPAQAAAPAAAAAARSRRPARPPSAPAPMRRDAAAVVGRACLHQPVRPEERRAHGHAWSATCACTEVGTRVRHAPHRARLRRDAFPGAGRPVDRHRAAGRRRQRPAAPRAPVFDRQPAQRRAAGLQQPVADGQARARGPPGQAGARRGQQLHVRPEGRRQGAGDRPLRHQLPDAEPPAIEHRHDLHRHRQRADARDDRMAAAPARRPASSKAAS